MNNDHKNSRTKNVKYKKSKKKLKKKLEKLSFKINDFLLEQWVYRKDDQKSFKKTEFLEGKITWKKTFVKSKKVVLLEIYFFKGGTHER